MRIAVVTELAGLPEEGVRNWIRDLLAGFAATGHEAELLELGGHYRTAAFQPSNLRALRRLRPDVVQYVPYSGLTRNGLARLAALRLAAPSALASLAAVQLLKDVGPVPRGLRAPLAICSSARIAAGARRVSRRALVMPPVVDATRFAPGDRPQAELRRELGLEGDRPLVIHVGHLRAVRNLGALATLARTGRWDVAMIASSSHADGSGIEQQLRDAGVRIVARHLPRIEEVYQAADAFVFPATQPKGAIEVPLGVLEAMACGLPVASTRFGGLPDFFPPSAAFVYADADRLEEAVEEALAGPRGPNRAVVEHFTPERLAIELLAGYEKLRR